MLYLYFVKLTMTFFLIWYAVWLKDKIKTVLRTFMMIISIFVLYTSVAHAQTSWSPWWTGGNQWSWTQMVLDTAVPLIEKNVQSKTVTQNNTTVKKYLDRLLALQKQTKWEDSPAFSKWNYDFFVWFTKQLDLLPEEDHIRMVEYTIKQITALTVYQAKENFSIQKWVVIAILTWIQEMVENDNNNDNYREDNSDWDENWETKSNFTTNWLYSIETETVAWVDYYIYTLKKQNTIKYADFHDDKWSFVHCMYSQCNTINFSETRLPKRIFVQYALWEKNEIIDLTKSTWSVKKEIESDDESEDSIKHIKNWMTRWIWKYDSINDTTRIWCQEWWKNCDAYNGDTSCENKLPLYCVKDNNYIKPNYSIPVESPWVMSSSFYNWRYWGDVKLSEPVRWNQFKTLWDANVFCEEEFWAWYRVWEFHDWKWWRWIWVKWELKSTERFRIDINDQQSTCWDKSKTPTINENSNSIKKTTTTESTTTTNDDDADLLQELSDIFWWAF